MQLDALRIRLFGPLEVQAGDKYLPLPASPAARSALAYLIHCNHDTVPRDRLLGMLWPERPEAAARRALSHALWQIRDALGPANHRLETEQDTLRFKLQDRDWVDVARFHALLRAGPAAETGAEIERLRSAVQLYRADFLEQNYDDWVLLEREQLREQVLAALERLLALYKQEGGYNKALLCALRLVDADPLREAAHRELMRLYYLLERPRAALRQYHVLTSLLASELGLAPDASTAALYQEISAATETSRPAHLPLATPPAPILRQMAHLPFVGRADERREVLETLQAAVRGHGGVVLLEGDAGVGKTRLAREIVADAEWRGFRVGTGRADALAPSRPQQMLQDAFRELLTPLRIRQLAKGVESLWLTALASTLPAVRRHLPDLPPLPDLEPAETRRRQWEGMARCLGELSKAAPLLLLLEDLHGADEASLGALPYLAHRLLAHRVVLLLTCRAAEARQWPLVWGTLETLDRKIGLKRIRLSPFEQTETVEFIRRALRVNRSDSQAIRFAKQLQRESAGNALFLTESLKSLLEQNGLVLLDDGRWAFPEQTALHPALVNVKDLLAGRVRHLPATLREVLEEMALLGDEADFTLLSRISDHPPATLVPALEALRQREFLIETEEQHRFSHDLLREAMLDATPQERRKALHHRIAQALETLHADRVASLAHHYSMAERWDKAALYSQRAGDRARAAFASEEAIRYYTQALEALDRQRTGNDQEQRLELLLAREDVRHLLGRREAQASDLAQMARLADRLEDGGHRARVALRRSRYHEATGDYTAAVAAARAAAEQTDRADDVGLAIDAQIAWGRGLWLQGQHRAARARYERALSLARERGHARCEAWCLHHLGVIGYELGGYTAARDLYQQALAISRRLDDAQGEAMNLNSLANVCNELGEFETARTHFRQSLKIQRRIGNRRGEAIALYNLSVLHRDSGDGETARRYCEQALVIARELLDPRLEAYVLTYLGLILERLHAPGRPSAKDLTLAETHYAEALAIRRRIGQQPLAVDSMAGLARVALALGQPEQALRWVDEFLAWIEQHGTGGIGDVLLAYQTAHRVLQTNGQQERARSTLTAAYDLLMAWADRVEDEASRRSLLEDVWPNREIVAAYREMAAGGRMVEARLAAASAPTGRPLRDEERVLVRWTVAAAEDENYSLGPARRRHRLLRLLEQAAAQSAAPTVTELASALAASERTIKRDLAALRAAGHEVHTRGARS